MRPLRLRSKLPVHRRSFRKALPAYPHRRWLRTDRDGRKRRSQLYRTHRPPRWYSKPGQPGAHSLGPYGPVGPSHPCSRRPRSCHVPTDTAPAIAPGCAPAKGESSHIPRTCRPSSELCAPACRIPQPLRGGQASDRRSRLSPGPSAHPPPCTLGTLRRHQYRDSSRPPTCGVASSTAR